MVKRMFICIMILLSSFFLKKEIKYIDVIDLSENRVFGTFIKGE